MEGTGPVAFCGLYCGACGRFAKGSCPGCPENEGATWCKIRSCCMEHGRTTCADCTEHQDPVDCALYHNFLARVFGFIFRSDRRKCILRIKEIGVEEFAAEMHAAGRQSMPR